jgi:hypothetical protein
LVLLVGYEAYAREMLKGFWWGEPKKEPIRRLRHKCKDNTKMDHNEIGWEGLDWIHLVQDKDGW